MYELKEKMNFKTLTLEYITTAKQRKTSKSSTVVHSGERGATWLITKLPSIVNTVEVSWRKSLKDGNALYTQECVERRKFLYLAKNSIKVTQLRTVAHSWAQLVKRQVYPLCMPL